MVCDAASVDGSFHSLDIKIFNYSTNTHAVKGLVPSLWLHWSGAPFKRWGLVGGIMAIGDVFVTFLIAVTIR